MNNRRCLNRFFRGLDNDTTMLLQSDFGMTSELVHGIANSTNLPTNGVPADILPTMTSNSTPSGVCSASTEYDASHAAWKAANNSLATFYDGWFMQLYATTGWWKYDWGSGNAKTITDYEVWNHPQDDGTKSYSMKTWTFQGSNNDSTWTDLDSRTSTVSTASAKVGTFTIASPASYRYYRFNITQSWSNVLSGIGEVTMWASSPGPTLFNQAAQFDGSIYASASRLQIANSTGFRFGANGTGDFQLNMRLKYTVSSFSDSTTLLWKGADTSNCIRLLFTATGKPYFLIQQSGSPLVVLTPASYTYAAGSWHTLSVTRDVSGAYARFRLWEDGNALAEDTGQASNFEIPAMSNSLYIGYSNYSGASPTWTGPVQDAIIRNTFADFDTYKNNQSLKWGGDA